MEQLREAKRIELENQGVLSKSGPLGGERRRGDLGRWGAQTDSNSGSSGGVGVDGSTFHFLSHFVPEAAIIAETPSQTLTMGFLKRLVLMLVFLP